VANSIAGATDVIVVEMNLGQVFREVERVACAIGGRKARLLSKVGGEVTTPEEILHFVDRGA